MHPFEKSNLGTAPFHVTHIEKSDIPQCCMHCGTGIRFMCFVQDAKGNKFHVGTECARKANFMMSAEVNSAEHRFKRAQKCKRAS